MTDTGVDGLAAQQQMLRGMLTFDPLTDEFRADPFAVYEQARALGSVARSPLGVWTVTGYEECSAVLKDDASYGWGDGGLAVEHFATAPDGTTVRQFNFTDPPEHTRVRAMVNRAFTPRRVEMMRGRARELLDELVTTARAGSGPIELVGAVLAPLPALVLGELIGVRGEDEPWFRELCKDIERGLDLGAFLTPEQVARRDNARATLYEYFGEIAEERRANPADDLVSELVNPEQGGDRLTETELRVNLTLLLTAGYVTMINMVGNGLLALLRHPEQHDWLRAHPERIDDAVEEMVRYDGPGQMVGRVALRDAELGGQQIKAGDSLMLVLGAANRDPAVFERPGEFDLSRPPGCNLGFGHGIHFCVGAPLARMITQVGIGGMLGLDIRLAGTPRNAESITIRGLVELPVTIA